MSLPAEVVVGSMTYGLRQFQTGPGHDWLRKTEGPHAHRSANMEVNMLVDEIVELRSPLLVLVRAMVDRAPVRVLVDLKNGIGEVTREAGWETTIREIRRPALHEAAYGHLEPVIVIDGGQGLSICLRAEDVEVVS